MTFNLTRSSFISTFICLILLSTTIFTVRAEDAKGYITKLKTHYQKAPKLDVFALNYHYLGREDPDEAWDYQSPERYMALRLVEIDLVKKHFVENDVHHFSGGLTANRIQFQNDKESLFYDKNGLSLGKRILNQSLDTFEEFRGQNFMNLDFLAVKSLLEEVDIAATITLHHNKISNRTTLTHQVSEDNVVDYVFSNSPLQLVSVNKKAQHEINIYDDYQTTNGITFARSILKYRNGIKKPSFVHRIDQLHILDKIDPIRFQVPKDFGPIIPESDNTLFSKEIASNLYLVSNVSNSRNVLFKVNGDKIMVFGGTASPQLAEETIQLILTQYPKKKIASVYVTHPHRHQIAGLKTFVEQGIEVLADEYSITAIKASPIFTDDINRFKFRTIKHEQVIDGAHFYVLENMHAKRQSFVHFKDSEIIYQSHFLYVAFDNTIAKVIPNFTKTFIDFIRSKQLKFNRIVSSRNNNNISVEVMDKTYEAY